MQKKYRGSLNAWRRVILLLYSVKNTDWEKIIFDLRICNVRTFSAFSAFGISCKACAEIQASPKLEGSGCFSVYPVSNGTADLCKGQNRLS